MFDSQTNSKPSASGFEFERRQSGVREHPTRRRSRCGECEGYEASADEIKHKRAQGECLGIRSR